MIERASSIASHWLISDKTKVAYLLASHIFGTLERLKGTAGMNFVFVKIDMRNTLNLAWCTVPGVLCLVYCAWCTVPGVVCLATLD